jgi:hypothetical protein
MRGPTKVAQMCGGVFAPGSFTSNWYFHRLALEARKRNNRICNSMHVVVLDISGSVPIRVEGSSAGVSQPGSAFAVSLGLRARKAAGR